MISKAVSSMPLERKCLVDVTTGVVLCKEVFCRHANKTNGRAEKPQFHSEREEFAYT